MNVFIWIRNKIIRLKELREEGYSLGSIIYRFLEYIRFIYILDICNKICQSCYVGYLHKRNNKNRKIESKNIAIIVTNYLGDSILFIDAIRTISQYCKSNNYELDVFAPKSIIDLYQDHTYLNNINYICYEVCQGKIKYKELKRLSNILQEKYYQYLLLELSSTEQLLLAGLFRKGESFYYHYRHDYNSRIDNYLIKKYITDARNYPEPCFIPYIYKDMLIRIGLTDYTTSMGEIKKENQSVIKGDYVVICPVSSRPERSLAIEQCYYLVEFLRTHYPNTHIVISCTSNNDSLVSQLKKLTVEYNLIDYIANTNLSQLISILSGAKLVIGCDSGPIHMSAGLGVKSICFKGYWDKEYFLPYSFDNSNPNTTNPIVIYPEKMECAYCNHRTNLDTLPTYKKCMTRKDKGLAYQCIIDIDMKKVENAIHSCLS